MVEGYAVISVTRPLDYEMVPKGMIYLTVMAKDGGNPPLNSTVPVTVEVIDENDNPPEFSKSSYIIKISENLIAGATVLVVNATDLDSSREFGQASLIYSLEGSSQFRLNSRSGELTTTALLDREQKSEYILIVRAVDGGVGPQQKTGIATVQVPIPHRDNQSLDTGGGPLPSGGGDRQTSLAPEPAIPGSCLNLSNPDPEPKPCPNPSPH
ncbi:Cadherin-23 [Ameca splendens]|uniref:Cadherin-23 n=1 Tax=Ameca splendens TaxID=208324 RepID=A0ABV0Y5D9_9TELE